MTGAHWYAASADLYDRAHSPLPGLASAAARGDAAAVAAFVGATLAQLRGLPVQCGSERRLALLLSAKYAAALAGGLTVSPLGGFLSFALMFYAIEAQLVFLAPALLDRPELSDRELFIHCRDLTGRAGGTAAVMGTVLPIAVRMLRPSRDPVRTWSLGAIAVVLWYEWLRAQPPSTPIEQPQLDVGGHAPLHVRTETVPLGLGLRVLHASDLHLRDTGRSRRVVEAIAHAAQGCDLLLLGGDLLDGRSGAPLLAELIRRCPRTLAIEGNHDRFTGLQTVWEAVAAGGGEWVTGGAVHRGLVIDARPQPGSGPRLLLVHNPREAIGPWEYPIAVAGHLHGGQVVAFEGRRQWPGALLSKWTGRRFEHGGMVLIVNRGASDTLPIRWRCNREVVRLEL